jgi:hypothetical protein
MNSDLERKIRGLMRKSLDPTVTEAEAASYAALAAKLCFQYNIDQTKINIEDPQAPPPKIIYMTMGHGWAVHPRHHLTLRNAVAGMYQVVVFYANKRLEGGNKVIQWFLMGLETSVQAAILTFIYLDQCIETMLKKRKQDKLIIGVAESNSYRKGATLRICILIAQATTKMIESSGEAGQALIKLSDQLIKNEEKKLGLKESTAAKPVISRADAFSLGFVDGGEVNIHGAKAKLIED